MIREALDIHKFKRSGETPPLDEEDWIMWKFQHKLLTNDEAVLEMANRRRLEAVWNRIDAESDAVIAAIDAKPEPEA